MKTVLILVTGTAVFVLMMMTRLILKRISSKYPKWKKAVKLFPLAGTVLWSAFIFWGTGILFKDRTYYPYIILGMVLIVMGLVAWYFIRDVFAGALLNIQNELNRGDYIKIGNIGGQVKAARLTHLEINTDNGQMIRIPHARLSQEYISLASTPEGMEESTISLRFDKSLPKQDIVARIRHELVQSPWCNYKSPPSIHLKHEDEETYTYELLIYTLNQRHLRMVEQQLKNRLEQCLR